VVGVEPVSLPGVVTENHRGPESADFSCNPASEFASGFEIAIDLVHEDNFPSGAEPTCGFTLLLSAQGDERCCVRIRVPRPLRSVGENQMMDEASGSGPFGKSSTTAELDVVWMGADRERDVRDLDIDAHCRRLRLGSGDSGLSGVVRSRRGGRFGRSIHEGSLSQGVSPRCCHPGT